MIGFLKKIARTILFRKRSVIYQQDCIDHYASMSAAARATAANASLSALYDSPANGATAKLLEEATKKQTLLQRQKLIRSAYRPPEGMMTAEEFSAMCKPTAQCKKSHRKTKRKTR